jgi:hypothetical protein
MPKIVDPNAGIPGGYFLKEDGTAINARGEEIDVMSASEVKAALAHARGEKVTAAEKAEDAERSADADASAKPPRAKKAK